MRIERMVWSSVLLCALVGGCSSNGANGDGGSHGDGGAGTDQGTPIATFEIAPVDAVVTVVTGQPAPTVSYTASWGGQSVQAAFTLDRGELGTLDAQSGLFTPGMFGGRGTVTATFQGMTAKTSITVNLDVTQKGDPDYTGQPKTGGSGGYGGVGGDGPGGPTTPAQDGALAATPTADATVKLLYPYDGTVFPRGLLAPLLMWNQGAHHFDAVKLEMTTKSGNYHYAGSFATPAGGKPFTNLVIPAQTWLQMNYSSSADEVTVKLTFAEGGNAFGPYVRKWLIAPATLKGTVYYNSYGTGLVANSNDNAQDGMKYGAATLAIRPGKTDPEIIAGTQADGCRVCHTVSASGNRLVTQRGSDYSQSVLVDLMNVAAPAKSVTQADVNFSALTPDGTLLLSNSSSMINSDGKSVLYDLTGNTPGALATGVSGLPGDLRAGLPSFSPDGKHLAFNFFAGAGGGDGKSLGVIDFDQTMRKFSGLRSVYTPPSGIVVWPSYAPTGTSVIFQNEISSPSWGFTWHGAKGNLWWVDVASGTAKALERANGTGYLPKTADVPGAEAGHDDDTVLNYEPTVNPVVSGGYLWVVFTSRRMYGNVATLAPDKSDPRDYDFRKLANYTPKKLWVTAIDLNAAPGTDPSHPAFYLPGQEIRAGNSRGFWTTEPCRTDGTSCESGDECCGGYCRPGGDGGALSCTSTPPMCAHLSEKCVTDADCCPEVEGSTGCFGGYCGLNSPPIP